MGVINVGITGMAGFIGAHLRDRLSREENISVVAFEKNYFDDPERLKEFLSRCDVVVHLAAVIRDEPDMVLDKNIELTNKLVNGMETATVKPHVIFSSSTQRDQDNPYGKAKMRGEQILSEWADKTKAPLSIMIAPNVFGDRARPCYNSVVATFCHQLTHDQEPNILVDNQVNLIYINELTQIIYERINNPPTQIETLTIEPTAQIKVSQLLALLENFKDCYYKKRIVPSLKNDFERNLYNTYLSYMEDDDYQHEPVLHLDQRGSLFEVVKQEDSGQIFFSVTKPGVVRGNHYHTRKMEKFCVVQGQAVIRLRRIGTDQIIEYNVSDKKPVSIEMPVLYTHNIENVGNSDLLTLFWTNELFDPNDPDTFYEQV
ncbi:NAD-dependent epimerase/dehydratase family protein [Planctomycetota bacterium]